ncbi:MAG: selenocysteine-specific translation elongation factor [Planctomycetaceae bacterium]|nr:selenocysteine-specific translation elongation factor [Planctomycetaceae bacterium]
MKHILIGTAGHIDHGKTRLVGRLTNINTDRLPEEKARGISIDLGFAHWESEGIQFGVVDVPGHERFVKNMVAGATGVNIALLVVAADDGVMPQTREHLEIMDLLGLRSGVIAITKTDLVDSEFVELVTAELEDLVAGTFLEGQPIVPVSSETGDGIDELKAAITQIAQQVHIPSAMDYFRMPVDRVFTKEGHGAVVTGSVMSGSIQAGDILSLLPEGREVRVRGVQNHGHQVDDTSARQRTAVNIAGVKADEIARGQELTTPEILQPTHRVLARLRSLSSAGLVIKDRMELTFHAGTAETVARVIFKGGMLKPGETEYCELRLKDPSVVAYGQCFILRRFSPTVTVAGGTIVEPFIAATRRVKNIANVAEPRDTADESTRLSALLGHDEATRESAAWRAGVPLHRYSDLMGELEQAGHIQLLHSGDRKIPLHRDRVASLGQSILRTINEELAKRQPRRSLPRNTIATACREFVPGTLLDAMLAYLAKQKLLVRVASNWSPADAQVKLTKKQQAALDTALQQIEAAGLAPPTAKNLAESLEMKVDDITTLISLCIEEGVLVRIADGLFFSPSAIDSARTQFQEAVGSDGLTISELREIWGVSRKFSVPMCEYFDGLGVTKRQGDVRVAGPKVGEAIP